MHILRFILLLLLGSTGMARAQQAKHYYVASYEGGMITHPGAGFEAGTPLYTSGRLGLDVGAKAAFYVHRHYRTAAYLLPQVTLWWGKEDRFRFGLRYGFGIQRTFIPGTYLVGESGGITHQKWAGSTTRLSSFGVMLSGRTRWEHVRWVLSPQLLQNPSGFLKPERYVVVGFGITTTFHHPKNQH